MTRLILLVGIIISASLCRAAAPPDGTLVHFDKSFYVTGEVVWYQLYLPPHTQGKDFSINLTIFNEKGIEIDRTFIATEGKTICNGHYALPFDMEAGMYRFLFTALDDRYHVQELALAAIPIYNDLKPLPADLTVGDAGGSPDVPALLPNDLIVTIRLATNAPPRAGQPVQLEIAVTDKNGNPVIAQGSISVADDALTGGRVYSGATIHHGFSLPPAIKCLPGIHRAGTVLDASGSPFSTPLLLALDVETSKLHFTKSDEKGRFHLQLPAYYGVRDIQMLERDGKEIKVVWQTPTLPAIAQPLRYTPGILDYLDNSRKRKKIYQLYSTVETDLRPEVPAASKLRLTADRSFYMPDYERFPDLATFFQEVVWMVKFTPKKGRYTARMYDLVRLKEFESPPLFLIDNKATFDADFIARLGPSDIETIDLLSDTKLLRQHFPALGSGGLVRINTLRHNQNLPPAEAGNITPLQGLTLRATFPATHPDDAKPHLNPLLLWQPALATNAQGVATVNYLQSDDRSTFCATVVVQSDEGRRGVGRFCYAVK